MRTKAAANTGRKRTLQAAGSGTLSLKQAGVLTACFRPCNLGKSLEAIASDQRISAIGLKRWLGQEAFLDAYRMMAFQSARETIPDLIRMLIVEARKGSIQHARLLLKLVDVRKGRDSGKAPANGGVDFDSEVLKGLMKRLEG